MRVFLTGATGFIGAAIVRELIGGGHQVLGLARSDGAAKSLIAAGASVQRGSLENLKSLKRGASESDGVIHMAFIHGFSHVPLAGKLRIFLGGAPTNIANRFMATMIGTDQRAIETMGSALAGSGRPLIVTVGTLGLTPNRLATERDAADPNAVGAARSIPSEQAVKTWAARGVRAMTMRLPPSVHGDGDTGFLPQLIATARRKKVSAMVGNGANRWPAVHRLDAARLYRLALENGEAGATYHGVAEEGVAAKDIASVIGRRLNLPVRSKTAKQAPRHFGWIGNFFGVDNPTSSALTRERLGWEPRQPGLLADLDTPHYFASRN